jgi:hypothetical protein
MMIVTALYSIVSFCIISTLNVEDVVEGIFFSCIYGYCFVVLYSLFYKFLAEREAALSGYVVKYQLAPKHKV